MSRNIALLRTLALLSVVALSAPLVACDILDEPDLGEVTPEEEQAIAYIRYINVNPAGAFTLHVDVDNDGQDELSHTLEFTQGSDYFEVPAGTASIYVTDSSGAEVVRVDNVPLPQAVQESIAFMDQPGIMIKHDNYADVGEDETRVNIRNVVQTGTVESWIGYLNDGGYAMDYSFDLGPNAEYVEVYPYHDDSVQLEMLYQDQDQLIVDWEFSSLVQDSTGSMVDAYTLLDGDCSYLSSTCEPWLIAHLDDGSTAVLEVAFGWVPAS